jgi:hypothetical protein
MQPEADRYCTSYCISDVSISRIRSEAFKYKVYNVMDTGDTYCD